MVPAEFDLNELRAHVSEQVRVAPTEAQARLLMTVLELLWMADSLDGARG